MPGADLLPEAYVSPVYPDGLPGRSLPLQPREYQTAVALHWFEINFRPVVEAMEQLTFSDGTPGSFSDGSPILFSSTVRGVSIDRPTATVDGAAPVVDNLPICTGRLLAQDDGAVLVDDFGRALSDDPPAAIVPFAELRSEFDGLIADDLLQSLSEWFLARSPQWQFIPFHDPLPIEQDGVARLRSEVEAARVRRDVEELEAHLAAQTATPQAHGQNYWPGAEFLDGGLRLQTEEVATTLRKAALAGVPSVEPVQQAAGKLAVIRNKVGQWIAEGGVKGLAADGAKWALASIPAWWHWLYHLLSELLTDCQAWLHSLLGG